MSSALSDFVQSNKLRNSGSQSFAAQFWNNPGLTAQSLRDKVFNGLSKSVSTASANEPLLNGDIEAGDEGENESQGKSHSRKNSSSSGIFGFLGQDDAFGLSRMQRLLGFFMCLLAGAFCCFVASFYIPLLVFKARKFAALYSLGSCFFVFSFSLLWGPSAYIKHLISAPRIPVTAAYFFSLVATLYASLWLRSTVLTVICATAQLVALVWFLFSYIPGGERGLRFISSIFTRICCRTVSRTFSSQGLPI